MEEIDVKKELLAVLDYYREQIATGKCTLGAMLTFYRILMENYDVVGTAEDFAKFFGVSEHNVRNVINRRLIAKPVRRVFYPFHAFLKIIPDKWLRNR